MVIISGSIANDLGVINYTEIGRRQEIQLTNVIII